MKKLVRFVLAAAALSPGLSAAVLLDIQGVVDQTDLTTQRRLFRDGVPSIWGTPKAFPGLNAAVGPRGYDVFSFVVGAGDRTFFQISVDDPTNSGQIFSQAYLDAFNPANLSQNYLGDLGFSPQAFGLPVTYQVEVPTLSKLFVVVQRVDIQNANSPNRPYGLVVESFYTSNYDDTLPGIPEPSTVGMAGLAAVAGMAIRRFRRV